MFVNRFTVNPVIICNIQGKNKTIARKTAIILGTKVKVISLIWVTAWKILTISPTTRLNRSIGADISNVVSSALRPISNTMSGVMN
jgi:hypothetical protein